ncbi:MAG: nucleotide exchange factor GrpE [Alphaproteobacteria bacterium]|nr:MAG: nucleotide exchange factor GrpE [Alphaproteobacteria bacterium]
MQDNTHPKERAEKMDNENDKKQTTPPADKACETEQSTAAPEGQEQRSDAEVLDALMAENADLKDKMLRALAEVENIRRRSQKEREDTAKYAVTSLARELAGVVDNLERALAAVPQEELAKNPQLQNIYTGVEATEKQLMRALENAQISKITPPLGEVFDPNFHEVMFEAEIPGKAGGEIIEVMESGYLIHDRLLRPARVGVAKRSSDNKAAEKGENS